MKKKSIVNILIISSILLILYFFVGHDFVKFYVGGKAEILNTAAEINKQCNADGACPTSLEGWQVRRDEPLMLSKGNMLYFVTTDKEDKDGDKGMKNQSFKLVYRFFMPDDWFEVQGGVGKQVISGWKSR
jgi:hypothetical protein